MLLRTDLDRLSVENPNDSAQVCVWKRIITQTSSTKDNSYSCNFFSTFSEFQWVHAAQDHCGRFRKLEPKKDDVAAVAYGILLQYPFDENNIFEMTTFITLDKRLVVVFSRKCG